MTPFASTTTKVLLLENVNQTAVAMLKGQGYIVDEMKKALGEDDLIKKLKEGGYTALGIRSKTKVTARVIREAGERVRPSGNHPRPSSTDPSLGSYLSSAASVSGPTRWTF